MCSLNLLIILRLAFQKKATRQPGQLKDSRGIPLGFFDDARDLDHVRRQHCLIQFIF